jgi:hypothetical protein
MQTQTCGLIGIGTDPFVSNRLGGRFAITRLNAPVPKLTPSAVSSAFRCPLRRRRDSVKQTMGDQQWRLFDFNRSLMVV